MYLLARVYWSYSGIGTQVLAHMHRSCNHIETITLGTYTCVASYGHVGIALLPRV